MQGHGHRLEQPGPSVDLTSEPAQFRAFFEKEVKLWGGVVRAASIWAASMPSMR